MTFWGAFTTENGMPSRQNPFTIYSTYSHTYTLQYTYSVVSIKRTGSLNYFGVFSHPVLFFHVLKKKFAPPCSFFHVLKKNFAPPCSLITSCSLNRYYRVVHCLSDCKNPLLNSKTPVHKILNVEYTVALVFKVWTFLEAHKI